MGICQSRHSYRNILDDLQDGIADHIRKMVDKGKEIRVTFDNFDFRILTNIIINGYQNSDMHWICQYITFDRISSSNLDNSQPIMKDIKQFDNKEYLLSKCELKNMRDEYIVLVSRVLVEFFPCMKVIRKIVPQHISHKYSKEMAEKSEIISMPIVPYNQNKTSDVCRYLEYLSDFLVNVYGDEEELTTSSSADLSRRKSAVLQNVQVPLVGDLLGRERVTGAKKTRAGCDHSSDKFEHIVEVPAVWHAKQFFLSVC